MGKALGEAGGVELAAIVQNGQVFTAVAGSSTGKLVPSGLYTPEQRLRRDSTRWTLVQGLLAPFQFFVMLISVALIARFLMTSEGLASANLSIVAKTLTLYTIMITGAIWEKVVFGQYLFAPAFFWEDVVSMGVIALHTFYLIALYTGALSPYQMMALALAAYALYAVNAVQFILKLRRARLQAATLQGGSP
jgi:3-vinyl bacteriochlorophyllide hydratase